MATTPVSFRCDANVEVQLRKTAKQLGITVSDVIIQAIEKSLPHLIEEKEDEPFFIDYDKPKKKVIAVKEALEHERWIK